jgi:hypothetical protein
MNGIELIRQWYEVKETGDIKEMSKFLYQNCQEALRIVESQLFALECLADIIAEKDALIEELEELEDLNEGE